MKFIFPGWLYLKIIQDDAKVLNPRSGSKSHNVDKVWSNWWCLIYGKYLSQVVLPTSSLLVFFCVDDVILRAILGVSWPPFCSRISMLALYWAIYIFSSLGHTFPVHLFYLLYRQETGNLNITGLVQLTGSFPVLLLTKKSSFDVKIWYVFSKYSVWI